MDYQEAINILRRMMNTSIPKQTQGISTAISAMRELQMYRDGKLCLIPESVYEKQCAELDTYKQFGTLEEMKLLKETHLTGVELAQISCMLKQLAEYEKIGTLEEVRDAVEKQREKKTTYDGDGYAPDGTPALMR